jgi:TRAP-type mannitol/chloroaromatic compound transport system substrate-binding protein
MSLPEIKDILHTADGITDKPMESDEVAELIVEINDLNAKVFTLNDFPRKIKREVNERYEEATKKRREAEAKIEDWESESATDANLAYWEGHCHALAAIKRAMVI